ncbi:hypothetical protein E2C01_079952 [Portunus trituberculatus]|uniref:Uncharacterized protein n=1 Tax=Portunus trituberculatus TaxID=210409 RepID=A0A5B7ISP2_PORTR|nr:hypothetical protein [Portunus trituberculatus]
MSTIGEQSSPENNEVSEEQQSLDAEDDQAQHDVSAVTDNNTPEPQSEHDHLDTSTEARLSEDQPSRYNLRDKTPSPLEQVFDSKLCLQYLFFHVAGMSRISKGKLWH